MPSDLLVQTASTILSAVTRLIWKLQGQIAGGSGVLVWPRGRQTLPTIKGPFNLVLFIETFTQVSLPRIKIPKHGHLVEAISLRRRHRQGNRPEILDSSVVFASDVCSLRCRGLRMRTAKAFLSGEGFLRTRSVFSEAIP